MDSSYQRPDGFHPIKIGPAVPVETIPDVGQKKEARNTKLLQEVEVTVTQTYHEVMSVNAGT